MNDSVVADTFGGRIRVRACGICVAGDRVLLTAQRGLLPGQLLYWSPPGGGLHLGEQATAAAEREVLEETGVTIKAMSFMFFREYIRPPLHAVELYFLTPPIGAPAVVMGSDPELPAGKQLITEARFMTLDEIRQLPAESVDPIFRNLDSLAYLCGEQNWPTIQKTLI